MSVRIINLTETASLQSGDFVAIDNGSQGTHKFDATKLGDIMGTNIAVSYSSASSYAVGQLCMYNGNLYQCNTAIGSGETWNPAHWTQVTVGVVLYDKVDKVAGKGLSTEDFTTALKNKLNGIEAGAEVNVQANWNEMDTSSDAYIQNKPTDATQSSSGFMSAADKTKLDGIDTGAQVNVQANWNETDTSSDAYIQNKPTNATQSTDGFMSAADKLKLDGIEAGAEVNVLEGVKVDGVALVIDDNKEVDIVGKANRSIIATEYNTATNYNVGDYVIYDQVLYKCIAPATGTWNSSKWEVAIIADDLARKANVDGLYENMTVGNAEQLISNSFEIDRIPYNFRPSGGSLEIGDREIDEIVGGTVAWNQLVQNGNFESIDNWSESGVTLASSNNVGTLTAASDGDNFISQGVVLKNSHKLLYTFDYKVNSAKTSQYPLSYFFFGTVSSYIETMGGTDTNWHTKEGIVQCIGETYTAVRFRCPYADTTTSFRNVCIIDLTQMFGTTIADYIYSLEQTTAGAGVAWFRKLFPRDYYDYNTGELLSVSDLQSHDMVGFNQWDEEWELGYYNTSNGQPATRTTGIRSKNDKPIKILPNTTYAIRIPYSSNGQTDNLLFYDESDNFISTITVYTGGTSGDYKTFTTPNNARLLRFYPQGSYGTTYNHDICINISDPDRNGEYEPYVKHSYPLDDSLTLRGIPKLDSSNRLYYDGDRYKSDGTVERRYGIVDLGTLTWSYISGANRFVASYPPLKQTSTNYAANIISSKGYKVVSWGEYVSTDGPDKCIASGYRDSSRVYIGIRDTSYTSAEDFKAAMSGVYLVYELAESTTEQATPYQNPQIVDNLGTEEYVIGDEVTVPIPVGHDTEYTINLRAKIEVAPDSPNSDGDYIMRRGGGINTYAPLIVPNELPTMPTTDGTYRLQVVVSSGTATLSWVSAT